MDTNTRYRKWYLRIDICHQDSPAKSKPRNRYDFEKYLAGKQYKICPRGCSCLTLEDSFDKHIEDTMIAGAGECDQDVVKFVVKKVMIAYKS